jgi:mono/diheme cytochrome c family protein
VKFHDYNAITEDLVKRTKPACFLSIVVALFLVFSGEQLALAEDGGAATFKAKCVLCHGADGTGNTPLGKQLQAANLRSKDVQKKTNAELHKVIHDGQTNMPPFGDQLSDQQINQVIRYVRTLGKTAKP